MTILDGGVNLIALEHGDLLRRIRTDGVNVDDGAATGQDALCLHVSRIVGGEVDVHLVGSRFARLRAMRVAQKADLLIDRGYCTDQLQCAWAWFSFLRRCCWRK